MAKVDMSFPSNSDKSREITNRPPVEPVIHNSSNVTSASKSWGQRLLRAFISSDATNIKEYIICDVIIPTIKNTIVDVVEMTFFGNSTGRGSRYSGGSGNYYYNYAKASKNAYNSSYGYYGNGGYANNTQPMTQEADLPDYRDIVITGPNARYEAEKIVTEMRNNLEMYGSVPVSDLYRLCGMTPDYTKENWGWGGDPAQIGIRMVNGGWLIVVPNASPI